MSVTSEITVSPLVDELRVLGGEVQFKPLREDDWRSICTVEDLRTTPVSDVTDYNLTSETLRKLSGIKTSLEYAHHNNGVYTVRDEFGKLYVPFGDIGLMDNKMIVQNGKEYDDDLYARNLFNPSKKVEIVRSTVNINAKFPSGSVFWILVALSITVGMLGTQLLGIQAISTSAVVSILLVPIFIVTQMFLTFETEEAYDTIREL